MREVNIVLTLEEARKKAGFSQGGFSQKLGLPQSTYCQYETGKRDVPADVATQICRILCVAKEDIFLPKTFTVSKS